MLHGFGHEDGVGGGGDGGVHEDAVCAHFHGEGGVGGGAYTGVDDEGDVSDFFAKDLERGAVLNAEAGADGGGERHDGGGSGIDEAMGKDDVVGGVGEDGESFFDEDAGGFEGGLDVGVEGGLVADDFDLDPVGEADFAGETGGADGFVGGVTAGGVGEEEVAAGVDEVEQGFHGAIQIDAADGDGDHLCAGGFQGGLGFGAIAVFAGADDEARLEGFACYDEGFHGDIVELATRVAGLPDCSDGAGAADVPIGGEEGDAFDDGGGGDDAVEGVGREGWGELGCGEGDLGAEKANDESALNLGQQVLKWDRGQHSASYNAPRNLVKTLSGDDWSLAAGFHFIDGSPGERRNFSWAFAEPDDDVSVENDHFRFITAFFVAALAEDFFLLRSNSSRSDVPTGKMSSSHSQGSTMGDTISPTTFTLPFRKPRMLSGFSCLRGTSLAMGLPRLVMTTS